MRQSIYLKAALLLIKIDIYQQNRKVKMRLRPERLDLPYVNSYLLKDIGLDSEGIVQGITFGESDRATRTVRHLRRLRQASIVT
ncbi:DUF1127 domain-containing protein [Aliivibrio kagoshimensis]|uniref:DUF1127 domain-containing protein n=1 Tax=Aliivibrio kagoshimensis TaxID=2910230 RepID=UPI003D10377D